MLEYETPKMTELLFACPEDIICTSPDVNNNSNQENEENGNNQDIFRKKNPVEKLTGLLK